MDAGSLCPTPILHDPATVAVLFGSGLVAGIVIDLVVQWLEARSRARASKGGEP